MSEPEKSVPQQHRAAAAGRVVRCAVLTTSDTRTLADDAGGALIVQKLESAGHEVVHRAILPDDAARITAELAALLGRTDLDAILTTGGTGVGPRDVTADVVLRVIEKQLPGFGEAFRRLSWDQVGSAAWLSRAAAGVASGKILFALPGSPKAVELAMDRLIVPELRHAAEVMRRTALS